MRDLKWLKSVWIIVEKHDEDAITEYEQKFISLGQPIYRCVWRYMHD